MTTKERFKPFLSNSLMDHQFLSLPILFSSILFTILFLKFWRNRKLSPKLPPGPRKLPLIGNLHQLVGDMPHRRLRDLASKYGPLMHLQLGEVPFIIISSPKTAEQVMKVHDINFASRPNSLGAEIVLYNSSDIALAPYGDHWRQMRKICIMELLSTKRVLQFRSIREEEILNFCRAIGSSAGFPVNLSKMLHSCSYGIIARALIGRKAKDDERYIEITSRIIKLFAGFSIVDAFPSSKLLQVMSGVKSKFESIRQDADEFLDNIIKEHKAVKGSSGSTETEDDLMHVLLNLQEHGDLEFPLTTDSIKAVIQDLILGGMETSATTVDWAISEMLKKPRVLQKAQAEVRQVFEKEGRISETEFHKLEYLRLVIKESLRLHPPLPLLIPRQGDRCEVNSYEIPAKAQVIVNAWAIGRDSKYWSDPEIFIPERFLESSVDFRGNHFELIPFGAGRRTCPGISFGLANVELTLVHLLYHFDWKLPDGKANEDLDMTEAFGSAMRRKWDLFVVPTMHSASYLQY